MKQLTFDILIVGAGPAGLAAAASASQSGLQIGLVDDNPTAGGQIWRGGIQRSRTQQAADWFERTNRPEITRLHQTRVIASPKTGALLAEKPNETLLLRFEQLILATGARERFLPFPGWTLPGVMGAGGLQALVKGGLPIKGKRVIVAGSGPLLLAVASYLRSKGALIRLIAEQAPLSKLAGFALQLPRNTAHLKQASSLGWNLLGVPYKTGCWITKAEGRDRLETVTIRRGHRSWREQCDYLACAYGLVPNIELASSLGCRLKEGAVEVNEWQQTSLANVYCAGESTGIGGLDKSLLEGQIAGFAAAGLFVKARTCFPAREQAHRFAETLGRSFILQDKLKTLPTAETLICRCEDVRYQDLLLYPNWRSAKLQTRCGMGPCQGRICGSATEFLYGWTQDSIRPPVITARLASLAQEL
ncbi:MAG TPA: FAD/NAD(P)-binding oxidoreductase [Ktedonobacteraceae bacterium]|nr:FAD/NAD(P)-binding oxidoreductase [Ktedonobacteraceae bacterium]